VHPITGRPGAGAAEIFCDPKAAARAGPHIGAAADPAMADAFDFGDDDGALRAVIIALGPITAKSWIGARPSG